LKEKLPKTINYHLEPGYVYVSGTGSVIRTVVGSCVAVLLWDPRRKAGGMNHFVHPRAHHHDRPTTRFGSVALPALLRMMKREFGSVPAELHAQIIGGANPLQFTHKTAADDNVAVARSFCDRMGIRVVSEDIGGHMGRKILFDTATGQVAILKVQQLRREDWGQLIH